MMLEKLGWYSSDETFVQVAFTTGKSNGTGARSLDLFFILDFKTRPDITEFYAKVVIMVTSSNIGISTSPLGDLL